MPPRAQAEDIHSYVQTKKCEYLSTLSRDDRIAHIVYTVRGVNDVSRATNKEIDRILLDAHSPVEQILTWVYRQYEPSNVISANKHAKYPGVMYPVKEALIDTVLKNIEPDALWVLHAYVECLFATFGMVLAELADESYDWAVKYIDNEYPDHTGNEDTYRAAAAIYTVGCKAEAYIDAYVSDIDPLKWPYDAKKHDELLYPDMKNKRAWWRVVQEVLDKLAVAIQYAPGEITDLMVVEYVFLYNECYTIMSNFN